MAILKDKVAVITGAGRGIGRAHALLFAREGAKVVVNDPGCSREGTGESAVAEEVVATIRTEGGEAVASMETVGSLASAERIVQTAVEHYGRVDVLVNNAGILRDRTLLKMSEEEWDDVIRVHLRGTFCCLKAAAAQMKQQGRGGRIINTSSSSGLLGNFGQTNYGAAKAGIHILTRIAAMELAKEKITVNAIAPVALTRMLEDMSETSTGKVGGGLEPERISPLVLFLASDAAAGITGQTFGIEGKRLFIYRMMTSHGLESVGGDGWTVEEIGKSLEQVIKWLGSRRSRLGALVCNAGIPACVQAMVFVR